MIPFSDSRVEAVFQSYPDLVVSEMMALRDLVFSRAEKTGNSHDLTETLKWGEPAYLCKTGSTFRMHWRESDPDNYRMFFHCQTSLVPTFRKLYPDSFAFEDNRAIRLPVGGDPDLEKLGHCIELALRYHLLKDLPLLGADQ